MFDIYVLYDLILEDKISFRNSCVAFVDNSYCKYRDLYFSEDTNLKYFDSFSCPGLQ